MKTTVYSALSKDEKILLTEKFIKKVAAFSDHGGTTKKKLSRHINCSSCDGCG